MPWKQICERYPGQWVALVETDWDSETDTFSVARVAGHGAKHPAPFDQMGAARLHHQEVGHFFTDRTVPRGVNFIGLIVPG